MNETQKQLNREKRIKYKKGFLICDVLVVLCILANFGAVFLTGIMVGEEKYTAAKELVEIDKLNNITSTVNDYVKFYETNDIQADLNNWEQAHTIEEKTKSNNAFRAFLLNGFMWIFFVCCYILFRFNIYYEWHFYLLLFICIYLFILTASDFLNNYGLWLAKIIFGL